jgi:predicted lipoprotein with Yx(FWY)xxD motif
MRGRGIVAAMAVVGAVVTGGCAGQGGGVDRPASTTDVTLSVRSVPGLGEIIVNRGWTLYTYPPDKQQRVTCTTADDCLGDWPPLFVGAGHHVIAGPGVKQRLIGTVHGDGGEVVTYNHWPLYYYAKDRSARALNGQGQGFNWYVINPNGAPTKTAFASSSG